MPDWAKYQRYGGRKIVEAGAETGAQVIDSAGAQELIESTFQEDVWKESMKRSFSFKHWDKSAHLEHQCWEKWKPKLFALCNLKRLCEGDSNSCCIIHVFTLVTAAAALINNCMKNLY